MLGFPAFKAGTLHAITVDDRAKTPNFGKPLFNVSSILSLPELEVKGIRLYSRENGSDIPLGEGKAVPPDVPAELVNKVAALVSVVPSDVGLSQKKPITIEVGVGGGDTKSQLAYAAGLVLLTWSSAMA